MAGTRKVEIVPRPPDPGTPENVKLEIKEAAQIIKKSGRGRLPEEVVFDILLWTVEGRNWQWIQRMVLKRHERMLAKVTIEKYQQEHAPKIREMTTEWDREAISAGLARKAVRLRKLQKIADAVEERILNPNDDELIASIASNPTNLKALLSEYRQILLQIGTEVGDIQEGASGDIAFIGMSDADLLKVATGIIKKNPDIAVIAAERAGIRPTIPESYLKGDESHVEETDQEDHEE